MSASKAMTLPIYWSSFPPHKHRKLLLCFSRYR